MKPEIIQFNETPIAVLEHRAPPDRVMESVCQFIEWRKASEASPEATSRTFGIIFDDPESVAPEEFRFDIGGEITGQWVTTEFPIVKKTIPGGRCAKVSHTGSLEKIGAVVRQLYRHCLQEGGEELRDFPCFFHYRLRMPAVSEHEQLTDIYLPLVD